MQIDRNSSWSYLVGFLFVALTASGCGAAEGERPDYAGDLGEGGAMGTDTGSGTNGHGSSCPEGTVRDCRITIHQANGVTSCWDGVQLCENGSWSRCMDPDDVESADPSLLEAPR